jgi:hypothetical protein
LCEVREDILTYWGGNHFHACPLGIALIGKHGDAYMAMHSLDDCGGYDPTAFLSRELRISKEFAVGVFLLSEDGLPAREIARYLAETSF